MHLFRIPERRDAHDCRRDWQGRESHAFPPTQRARPVLLSCTPSHRWLWHRQDSNASSPDDGANAFQCRCETEQSCLTEIAFTCNLSAAPFIQLILTFCHKHTVGCQTFTRMLCMSCSAPTSFIKAQLYTTKISM